MEPTNKSNSINLGLYLGGFYLSLILVLVYAVNLDLFIEWWLGILLLVLVVAFGVVAAKKLKKLMEDLFSLKGLYSLFYCCCCRYTSWYCC